MTGFKNIYKIISKNEKLAAKRHPLVEQNKFMKVFVYIFAAFWAIYLMFFGVVFGQIDNLNYEIFDLLDGSMIIFLALDFFIRLTFQETPAQRLKPYKLMPIPQKTALDVFIVRIMKSSYNLFWLFFWIPFSFFAVLRFYGLPGFLAYNLGWVLLYAMNGLWFLIWRTLARNNAFIYLIPFSIYAVLAYTGIFAEFGNDWLFKPCIWLGRAFCQINPLGFLIVLALIAALFFVCRSIQIRCVYDEISNNEKEVQVKKNEMKWLDRFGVIGEYLKLEVKSTKRNKVVRKSFIIGMICVLLFSILFAFTDVYDNSVFMECFICVYCFACLGTITLTNIMCPEGNYIDFLMSRKESVFYLLKAKYYYNCALLLIPFLFSIMPVIKEKLLLVEILGCLFFVSGCVFPFLFQQAVYNKQTMPLNVQIISKGQNSKSQAIVSMVALFVPMIIMTLLLHLFNTRTASFILLTLGLIGTLCSDLWIKNIYKRFMRRRYVNMEGFRSTRKS